MKIGKETIPRTAICTSDAHSITVRGEDLCRDLIGKISFSQYFSFLVTGVRPTAADSAVLDAALVAIAEHGFVPSVQASRMTYAAAPDSLQGAVAAGILGCGSVILGASETAGRLFEEVNQKAGATGDLEAASREIVTQWRATGQAIPGYGHPQHKERDPRVAALFQVARASGANLRFIQIAEAVEAVLFSVIGKDLRMNVSAAIPAVLLGTNYPLRVLRGVPILARTAGLLAHLNEEMVTPSGFALSYQATRELRHEAPGAVGTQPEGGAQ
jgi:citrate synthase